MSIIAQNLLKTIYVNINKTFLSNIILRKFSDSG